jgi:hypothetical protein
MQTTVPVVEPQGGVGVGVAVLVGVKVFVAVAVGVGVQGSPPTRQGVGEGVGVNVGVGVFVGVDVHGFGPTRHGVFVAVGVFVDVEVDVGVGVSGGPTLTAAPSRLLMPMSDAPGVSSVTPARPMGLAPWAFPVKGRRRSAPKPLAPGGGTVPRVTHTTRTVLKPLASMIGQSTVRPLLPRKSDCTCAVNAPLLAGGAKLRTDGSNVVMISNAPRFVMPWTATSIEAVAP